MKIPYSLHRAIDLQPGDHLCCLYETEEEHRTVRTCFLRQGLEQGDKVLYIVDTHTAEAVLSYLRDDGLEIGPYLAQGQLNVFSANEAYTREGIFDPDDMTALLRTETERALSEGYRALRVTGEMTWALRGLPGSERLIEYEAKLNDFFSSSKCLAICQYDRRRFDPALLLDVLATHPLAVVGTEIFDNFYYMPPKDFFGKNPIAARVSHWLDNLFEWKRAEEALRESEANYRLLIDNLPGIVYKGYKNWSVDFMDEKIELLTGYNMEKFNSRQRKWSDVILGTDIEIARVAFIKALKTDKSFVREYRIKTISEEILWIQDRGYIACDNEGEVEYVSGVFFDVTERKRLEKALMQREKLESLGAIAAEVAHEIRNPLVSIGGFARRLRKRFPDSPECDIILSESQRLERILSRIRNYLKPIEICIQECSANKIIVDCVELLSPEIDRRQVRCGLDLDSELSAVYLDPGILAQIFINLIRNAVEAMDKGGTLSIKAFESDKDLQIEFKNKAPGREFEHPEPLFMLFAEGGESIGLPLSYRLLKDMGGLLSFTQEEDYMVFTVSLPKQSHRAN